MTDTTHNIAHSVFQRRMQIIVAEGRAMFEIQTLHNFNNRTDF